MTKEEILHAAMAQSALELGCRAEDFCRAENVIVRAAADPRARRYLRLPFFCNLVSYGGNLVASVSEEAEPAVRDYLARYPAAHCFETPHLHVLEAALRPMGQQVCFMAEYFLPDPAALTARRCAYTLRLLAPAEFQGLYTPEWSNALCAERRQLDVLAVGAYDGARLIGLAGCSADCDGMWQIGVDVLPAYRRRGVAAALTSRLAVETLRRGKIPFYCAAWSNLPSVRNALRCGFFPTWVELTARPAGEVEERNR